MLANSLIFVFGMLIATLGALLLVPVIWHKAQTLARREAEATLPMSPAEIQGEVDKVRAQAAMKIRSLEMSADKARNAAATARAENGVLTARLAGLSATSATVAATLPLEAARLLDPEDDSEEKSGELRILLATALMRIEQLEADLRFRQRSVPHSAAQVEPQQPTAPTGLNGDLRQHIMQLNATPGEGADAAIRSYVAEIATSVTRLAAEAASSDSRLVSMLGTARNNPKSRTGVLAGQMVDDNPAPAV
ncbi:hypothetical protein FPY71_04690 [Aureimonas fodinaquatilis]|uniref:Uncharacterized protein n=1 Tax=Aureimonas fodinaquatilis TaxID=2565783 RepID=A0A5B0E176_9HYPH|nr:hypothetical protein [Aureimonas fodinaquatilis]KAA0972396.1 hypothetical protein FPY71_04690 [Aureimonas fodinaquatilis]